MSAANLMSRQLELLDTISDWHYHSSLPAIHLPMGRQEDEARYLVSVIQGFGYEASLIRHDVDHPFPCPEYGGTTFWEMVVRRPLKDSEGGLDATDT